MLLKKNIEWNPRSPRVRLPFDNQKSLTKEITMLQTLFTHLESGYLGLHTLLNKIQFLSSASIQEIEGKKNLLGFFRGKHSTAEHYHRQFLQPKPPQLNMSNKKQKDDVKNVTCVKVKPGYARTNKEIEIRYIAAKVSVSSFC